MSRNRRSKKKNELNITLFKIFTTCISDFKKKLNMFDKLVFFKKIFLRIKIQICKKLSDFSKLDDCEELKVARKLENLPNCSFKMMLYFVLNLR